MFVSCPPLYHFVYVLSIFCTDENTTPPRRFPATSDTVLYSAFQNIWFESLNLLFPRLYELRKTDPSVCQGCYQRSIPSGRILYMPVTWNRDDGSLYSKWIKVRAAIVIIFVFRLLEPADNEIGNRSHECLDGALEKIVCHRQGEE